MKTLIRFFVLIGLVLPALSFATAASPFSAADPHWETNLLQTIQSDGQLIVFTDYLGNLNPSDPRGYAPLENYLKPMRTAKPVSLDCAPSAGGPGFEKCDLKWGVLKPGDTYLVLTVSQYCANNLCHYPVHKIEATCFGDGADCD